MQLERAGVRLNAFAQDLFRDPQFTTAPSVHRVEVIGTTVGELGLPDGGTYAQVLEQARLQGLAVCPLELAPHLRLQWSSQLESPNEGTALKRGAPHGALTVASAAPPDEQDVPWGFYLRRFDGNVWLRGYRSWSGHVRSSEDRIAFIRATNAA